MDVLTNISNRPLRSTNPIRRQLQLLEEHRSGELSTARCGLELGKLHHQLPADERAANDVWAALHGEGDGR